MLAATTEAAVGRLATPAARSEAAVALLGGKTGGAGQPKVAVIAAVRAGRGGAMAALPPLADSAGCAGQTGRLPASLRVSAQPVPEPASQCRQISRNRPCVGAVKPASTPTTAQLTLGKLYSKQAVCRSTAVSFCGPSKCPQKNTLFHPKVAPARPSS